MRYTTIPDEARTYHYWRGFRSAAIMFVPIILVLMYSCNLAVAAFVK